jgi:hypothetical protein
VVTLFWYIHGQYLCFLRFQRERDRHGFEGILVENILAPRIFRFWRQQRAAAEHERNLQLFWHIQWKYLCPLSCKGRERERTEHGLWSLIFEISIEDVGSLGTTISTTAPLAETCQILILRRGSCRRCGWSGCLSRHIGDIYASSLG